MELAGVAHLRKVPTEKVGGFNGRPTRFVKRSGVDYVGVMLRNGQAVYVEVKRLESWRLPFDRIEPHQWAELSIAFNAHAVAVVLCVIGPERALCVVPFWVIHFARLNGDISILRDALEAYRVKGPNYLEAWT
jgi:hypothetical protein